MTVPVAGPLDRTRGLALGVILGLALGSIGSVVAAADAPPRASQQAIEEALTCQCGCGLTVHSCNHLQCPSGEPIKKEIAERLARGESAEVILAAFRDKFGEKVLSSPTLSGFNWLAWLTPFAAVLAGGIAMTVVIRRWVRATPAAPPPAAARPGDDEQRRRLAQALEDFDRET